MKGFKKGGIHPADRKVSCGVGVVRMGLPEEVVVFLGQHIGAPAALDVAKGDKVKTGQKIGEAAGFVSANVHAPVSGEVVSVEPVADGGGIKRPAVTIKTQGDEWVPEVDLSESLKQDCKLTPDEIVNKIRMAGIVGMGGATFPTHVKLSIPDGKKAEFLIINGVECEPYLTSDHRVMLERGEEMLVGIRILMRALGVERAYVGIENNKEDAIEHLRTLAGGYPEIEIVPLRVRYPQGGEKQLIEAVVGREVPSGGLPIDVGVVVQNVGTALAVYEAVQKNKPLVERVVTVTGDGVARPVNVLARVGTPISKLIEFAGGMVEGADKVINGGPMMGKAMSNINAPMTKGTSGIVVMNGSGRCEAGPCIKCTKCVQVCPMGLQPFMISKLSCKSMWDEVGALNAADCIECGSCVYTCPAYLPLLDFIRLGKTEVIIMRRK